MKKYLIVLSAVLMSMSLFAETAKVAFEANGRTKVMTVDLPHTFSCDYHQENGELDSIIQEFYELPNGGYCNDEIPVRTGNTMVSTGLNGNNQYVTVDDVFDGKAVVKGKYYSKSTTSEIGADKFDYRITISIWKGNAVGFNVYSSWANDNTTLSTSDFPNFLVIPEVKAQTLTISDSGIIYVIYDITGNGDVKCALYNDGAYVGLETLVNNTRKSFYVLADLHTFYYSYALTQVTPATPVISGDKYFVESNTVTITCASKGAVIYYTLNGDNPAYNPYCPVYEDPIEITENTTVRAASYNGDRWSDVAMMEFIKDEISLEDNADNSGVLSTYDSKHVNRATLQGRTLYKDGGWNTLCLPFNVTDGDDTDDITFSGTPLEGAIVKELDVAGVYSGHQTGYDAENGILYLYFKDASSIEAGKPYIIKWTSGGNIENPVFQNVTISNQTSDVSAPYVTFRGIYSPRLITAEDRSVLYLAANDSLHYPDGAMNINACRAYFQLNGILAQELSSPAEAPLRIVSNLDAQDTATALENTPPEAEIIKYLKDGVLYILRDGILYDAMGKMVKHVNK